MKTIYKILLVVNILYSTSNVYSQGKNKRSYFPSYIGLQYAGNIGKYTVLPSWSIINNQISLEASLGFVPNSGDENDIYITSFKALYVPKVKFRSYSIIVKPITVGFAVSYTHGKQFSKYWVSENYPDDYYWWNTSFRYAFVYQTEISKAINTKLINTVSFYFEASIWDLELYSYGTNSNYKYFSLYEIITLGVGIRFSFK